MTNQHPVNILADTITEWRTFYRKTYKGNLSEIDYIAANAAQWGADQQLEVCCENLKSIPSPLGIPFGEMASNALRNSCRPEPPSLKEEALQQLDEISNCFRASHGGPIVCDKIRKALEELPND